MAARARKKFLTSPNFGFSDGGRVLSRGFCAMGAAGRKMRAFHCARSLCQVPPLYNYSNCQFPSPKPRSTILPLRPECT